MDLSHSPLRPQARHAAGPQPTLVQDTELKSVDGAMQRLGLKPQYSRGSRLADALAKRDLMRPLNGGGLLEGLARGGEAFFAARGARDERQLADQRRQAISKVISEAGGDRSRLHAGLASVDPELALQYAPSEQKPMELAGGTSLAGKDAQGNYQTLYTAPKMNDGPAPNELKEGMMFLNGRWVASPEYWKERRGVAKAGVPQLPEGWGAVD